MECCWWQTDPPEGLSMPSLEPLHTIGITAVVVEGIFRQIPLNKNKVFFFCQNNHIDHMKSRKHFLGIHGYSLANHLHAMHCFSLIAISSKSTLDCNFVDVHKAESCTLT